MLMSRVEMPCRVRIRTKKVVVVVVVVGDTKRPVTFRCVRLAFSGISEGAGDLSCDTTAGTSLPSH